MQNVLITSSGIKKALKQYNTPKAIAEYVWNGFDAKATTINIEVNSNEIGTISDIRIADNGYGIRHDLLQDKFKPFFQSEKEIDSENHRKISAIHGKNGVGRLTFFRFATNAKWTTVYRNTDDINYEYSLQISSDQLDRYDESPEELTDEETGTIVEFTGIHSIIYDDFESEIFDYLVREFGWFLELNIGYKLQINGIDIGYEANIGERKEFEHNIRSEKFHIKYIRWTESLHREYSRYYFIDSAGVEIHKKTTTLNNKGDGFYHSVFIRSDFFDNASPIFGLDEIEEQPTLLSGLPQNETTQKLLKFIEQFLQDKRRPFLKKYTDTLIQDFKRSGAFPKFSNNDWDLHRRRELESMIRALYQAEPKIFNSLNIEQKKIFVHFLNLIIDSGERDQLLDLLDGIIHLDSGEREEFSHLLRTTKLSNIIQTIKLIEDRYKAIDELKSLVYNPDLKANERDHIQKFIESHYWIFGEQYHLVTAAEPKFEEALRRHTHHLTGKALDVSIEHPDKNKEMDIFMVRQAFNANSIHNVVIELKHPNVALGEKELSQVKKYMSVILSQPEFNGSNATWEFHLVGNRFSSTGYIELELQNSQRHGERSLVYSVDRYKIYVQKWSEVFADFELKHKFLQEKLELERKNLSEPVKNAVDIIEHLNGNSATQPAELSNIGKKAG